MITLEQIRLLDRKVNQAVEMIDSLKTENQMLSDKLESYQTKISELEVLLSSLKDDQSEVEQGFQKALETLSGIEEETAAPSPAQEPRNDEEADETASESGEDDEQEEESAELDIF
jgi:peptidoglycan hydrolase CwlO-like protein